MSDENRDSGAEMDIDEVAERSNQKANHKYLAVPGANVYPAAKSSVKRLNSIETENSKRRCIDDLRNRTCSEISSVFGTTAYAPSVPFSSGSNWGSNMFENLILFIQNHPEIISNMAIARYGHNCMDEIENFAREFVKVFLNGYGEGEIDTEPSRDISGNTKMMETEDLAGSMDSMDVHREEKNSPPIGFTTSEWNLLVEKAIVGALQRIKNRMFFEDI